MIIVISISLCICALGIIGCTGEGNKRQQSVNETSIVRGGEDSLGPDILFDTLVNSLGEIIEGEQVLCYFKYHNRGDEPLLIRSIKAGCGCTVPKWNEEPLKPGDSEDIKVLFNSSGKRGKQNIRITVTSNARTPISTLFLKAEVN